jgi:hypothetical protein
LFTWARGLTRPEADGYPNTGWGEAFISGGRAHATANVPATLSVDSVREAGVFRVKFFVTHTRGDPGACSLLIRQVARMASVSRATRHDLARNCHYRL